uniref:Transmembrane protein n=1 Tax=Solanum lycopersicum TaxID=4081 RepID=A0A3Q7GSC6_SOLLC
MANTNYLCCNFTTVLILFLVISTSSCARPLLNKGSSSIVEFHTKAVMNGNLDLLLHRLPKGKVPASAPGKRTNDNNN